AIPTHSSVCAVTSSSSVPYPSSLACDHPDLHSFPTRRSSDLRPGSLPRRYLAGSASCCRSRRCRARRCWKSASAWVGKRPSLTRSEEHTSELQSRENLVCRLLLEKKKIGPSP